MFGLYRYILAHLVVISHLCPDLTKNPPGTYAVFAFYTLSVYLITLILNEIYGFSTNGIKRFFINRFLRLYPAYLVTIFISVFLVYLIPDIAQNLNKALKLPTSFFEILANSFIFGLSASTQSRLVPPAWALNVELCFYVLMALHLVRKRKTVIIWFVISFLYTVLMIINNFPFENRYSPLEAASLPFSTGAMIYFMKENLTLKFKWHFYVSAFLFLINALYSSLWGNPQVLGFYTSFILNVWLLFYLIKVNIKLTPVWLRKIDKLLGNLSYPIYLCHWHIATLVDWLFFRGIKPNSKYLFFASLIPINIAAYVIYFLIENRVDNLRNKVRPKV